MLEFLLKFFLTASAIIVIILVMLQRGKGGGLAGALGGMGGQSAFGTKAGDLFTKITVGVASFWILISVVAAIYAPHLSGDPDRRAARRMPGPAESGPRRARNACRSPRQPMRGGSSCAQAEQGARASGEAAGDSPPEPAAAPSAGGRTAAAAARRSK